MSKMNLPNKLTIFRVILIVPFIILLLGGPGRMVWREYLRDGYDRVGYLHHCQSHGSDRR